MTIKELKAALEEMKLEAKGSKAALVARLQEAKAAAAAGISLHSHIRTTHAKFQYE